MRRSNCGVFDAKPPCRVKYEGLPIAFLTMTRIEGRERENRKGRMGKRKREEGNRKEEEGNRKEGEGKDGGKGRMGKGKRRAKKTGKGNGQKKKEKREIKVKRTRSEFFHTFL